MNIEKVSVKDIKLNPRNPRVIKDDKFKKLVKSVEDFPEMLEIRPIVVDDTMTILGGNMRFKACLEAGLTEVSIIIFGGLTEEKKHQFLIKDNVNYGDWDYMMLENTDTLDLWGMDLPDWLIDNDDNNDDDDFFNDDFIDSYNNTPTTGPSLDDTDFGKRYEFDGSCILLNMDIDDYNFYKNMEQQVISNTKTKNISDAFKQMLKNK
jgi:hypothetical protein